MILPAVLQPNILGAYSLEEVLAGVVAGDPIIVCSDLISAPRAGWSAAEPNKGAAISVFGLNFSTFDLGNTYITVGGVNITASADYPVTWGETSVVPFLKRIVFHLNSTIPLGDQAITVTINGKTSIQTIPLKVTANNIYFADANATTGTGTILDPWKNPVDFTSIANGGDVLYCRAGTFTDKIDGGNTVWWIRSNSLSNDGTVTDPIGISGYPNEIAIVNGPDAIGGSTYRGISINSDYYTVSNMSVTATGFGIDLGGSASGRGHRAVGNDVLAMQASDASGHIITQGSNCVAYANYVHGGRTGNKLDHAIYVAGDASDGGAIIAFNYAKDNDFDSGPIMVVNHQEGRIPTNKNCKSHYFFCNFIDSTDFPTTAFGMYDQSLDEGVDTGGEPEPTYVYNNIDVGAGVDNNFPASSSWAAHVIWWNNTTTQAIGTAFEIANARVISCEYKNNILDMLPTQVDKYISEEGLVGATVTLDKNVYFGSTGGGTNPLIADPNGFTDDPVVVADLVNATITQAAWTRLNMALTSSRNVLFNPDLGQFEDLAVAYAGLHPDSPIIVAGWTYSAANDQLSSNLKGSNGNDAIITSLGEIQGLDTLETIDVALIDRSDGFSRSATFNYVNKAGAYLEATNPTLSLTGNTGTINIPSLSSKKTVKFNSKFGQHSTLNKDFADLHAGSPLIPSYPYEEIPDQLEVPLLSDQLNPITPREDGAVTGNAGDTFKFALIDASDSYSRSAEDFSGVVIGEGLELNATNPTLALTGNNGQINTFTGLVLNASNPTLALTGNTGEIVTTGSDGLVLEATNPILSLRGNTGQIVLGGVQTVSLKGIVTIEPVLSGSVQIS